MASSVAARNLLSERCPSERTSESGRAFPSAHKCSVVVSPSRLPHRAVVSDRLAFPFEADAASSGSRNAPAASGWALMRVLSTAQSLHSTLLVRFGLQGLEQTCPQSGALPVQKAVITGLPCPVAFGQIPPRCARASNPKHSVNHTAMVVERTTPFAAFFRGQVRNKTLPLSVRQITARHNSIPPKQ